MDGDPNRILRREKPLQLRERPVASDRFETEWAGAFGPVRQRRNRTGYWQDVENGDVSAVPARDSHCLVEGLPRALGEIDGTENVLEVDVDHDHLQAGAAGTWPFFR